MTEVRVDLWLWAVRVYKTRSNATDACRGGHVKVNRRAAKASTPVRAGDRVTVRLRGWTRELEVVQPIARRVGASVAAECMVEHSGPRPRREEVSGVRLRGAGRPTKRERRFTQRLRGR